MKIRLSLFCTVAVFVSIANSALAADTYSGEKIFMANCSGCHFNGLNKITSNKTLKKSDLKKYGRYSEQAIIDQVTPAFDLQLSVDDIEDVAAYVMKQAANANWK